MPAAPLPTDERLRLQTLASYEILDSAPDRRFDSLVQLAAEHFGVSTSLVSLVDADRQWFKAAVGLAAAETPREAAFCAHAIHHPNEILVVEDCTQDERFADNPLVIGAPAIRFYAGAPLRAENGQPLGTLCVIDNKARRFDDADRRFLASLAANVESMLELHRRNRVLSVASGHDALTGLANRRIFDALLAEACAAASDGMPFGLLALDLDHFKSVNDELGHETGDRLLQEVGRRLSHTVRETDLVARLGGDEFAIIAAGPIDLLGLRQMAERIMEAVAPDMPHPIQAVPIRASIGVALAPLHSTEPLALSRAADRALYRSKRAGRRAISLASEAEPAESGAFPAGSDLEQDLQAAIANRTLSLDWQPYFLSQSGRLLGYEALLRWNRPGQPALPPTDIVALAENGGVIDALDALVLRRACGEAASWRQTVSVSVNMTSWWFSHGDLLGLVSTILADTGLAAERLTIDLTEGTLAQHTDRVRERIVALRATGVRIALDDFGTANASLGHLCSFAFDTVKLDRMFVQGIGSNQRAETIAGSMLALGKALARTVCAEGVETSEQLDFFRRAGCDVVQGFLLGCPRAEIAWPSNVGSACWAEPAPQRQAAG